MAQPGGGTVVGQGLFIIVSPAYTVSAPLVPLHISSSPVRSHFPARSISVDPGGHAPGRSRDQPHGLPVPVLYQSPSLPISEEQVCLSWGWKQSLSPGRPALGEWDLVVPLPTQEVPTPPSLSCGGRGLAQGLPAVLSSWKSFQKVALGDD